MKEAIALYLDEDSTARDLVRALRQQEIDIITVGEVNRYGHATRTNSLNYRLL